MFAPFCEAEFVRERPGTDGRRLPVPGGIQPRSDVIVDRRRGRRAGIEREFDGPGGTDAPGLWHLPFDLRETAELYLQGRGHERDDYRADDSVKRPGAELGGHV
ncbi:hypothetical protein ACFQH2_16225 [Natronoarchaeum sp. GCM10025703]|uniref:hypothetical protein n=1 Tax=Natronoarchaeum sp. GCM10025703 TaxID=3252685 RepID=UPI003608DDBD